MVQKPQFFSPHWPMEHFWQWEKKHIWVRRRIPHKYHIWKVRHQIKGSTSICCRESQKQHIQRIPRKGDGKQPGRPRATCALLREHVNRDKFCLTVFVFYLIFFSDFVFLLVYHNMHVQYVNFWEEKIARNIHFVLSSLHLSCKTVSAFVYVSFFLFVFVFVF